ncbi:MAG: universal stress protein, partial [Fulvivirga sp.]|nr:universal stress protein [Fulvivirga sp.]
MSTKKILFPTDFSVESVHALRETLMLNQKLQYEIIIFHAYNRPFRKGDSSGNPKTQLKEFELRIDHKFEKMLEKIPELKSHNYRFEKALGYSVDMIIETIEKEKIDVVSMSTKGAVGVGD